MNQESEKIVVAGPGFMGQSEAKVWHEIAKDAGLKVGYLVDEGDTAKELGKLLGAELVVVPPLVKGERISLSFARKVTRLAKQTDIWNIAVPTWLHHAYLELALKAGVKKVFVEKPSTDSTLKSRKVLEKYPDALIQVDYIERGHPVVLAIRDRMKSIGFRPTNVFNWRAHDIRNMSVQRINSGDETKITMSNLLHDISEVEFLLKSTTDLGLGNEAPTLKSAKMVGWGEKYSNQYTFPSDLAADFIILFFDGVEARIRGEGDFDFKRYFAIWNEDLAFFGQTLTRSNLGITPVAAQIEGRENVEIFLRIINDVRLITDIDFKQMFDETSAQVLDLSGYERNALKNMIENLAHAKTASDLICPLSDAIAIEDMVARVYCESGNENMLTSRVVVNKELLY